MVTGDLNTPAPGIIKGFIYAYYSIYGIASITQKALLFNTFWDFSNSI